MSIFDQLFVRDGDEDLPRKTHHESHAWMMIDIEKAISMLSDVWDDNNTRCPNKVTAMIFKLMSQLYDVSPLTQNDLAPVRVMEYDKERVRLAAQSINAVLKYIKNHPETEDRSMSRDEYIDTFYWGVPPYTRLEYLWYNREQDIPGVNYNANEAFTGYVRAFWLSSGYVQGAGNDAASYNVSTQNMVDMHEKQGDGGSYYPISHPNAKYNDQKLYEKRDPRFYNNILYPGNKWGANASGAAQYITTYVDGNMHKTVVNNNLTDKRQQTEYLCKKFIREGEDQWKKSYGLNRAITVFIRVPQVYLDLAETPFEATGSAMAKVEGCDYSVLETLNVIRNRIGIGDVPSVIYNDERAFRQAIRRERVVGPMSEDHHWWDIRRWVVAHEFFSEQYPIKGIQATPKNANHANVKDKGTLEFTSKVIDVAPEECIFEVKNYWCPFSTNDAASLNNLTQNPGW